MSKSVNVFSIISGLGRPSVCGLHTLANKVPIVQFSASYLAIPSLFPLERMTLFFYLSDPLICLADMLSKCLF